MLQQPRGQSPWGQGCYYFNDSIPFSPVPLGTVPLRKRRIMRGLYVHIPFCTKKCHYCDFVITTQHAPDFREQFFQALEWEVRQIQSQYGRLAFDTIYFGGGTPSDLNAGEMTRLSELLKSNFSFADSCEWTCEVNPGDLDSAKLEAYQKLGINRISVGAQAFQDRLLKDLGRIHNVLNISESIKMIRAAGFQNINLDLMIRLPGQTLEDIEESLELAIALAPTHVSLYDLDIHPRTVFGQRIARGTLPLPDEVAHAEIYEAAEKGLERAGFRHYELLNFSKPGFESKHNLVYWHNEEYLGLGPGAFSYLQGTRFQRASDVRSYLHKWSVQDLTLAFSEVLTPENIALENLLTGLRLDEGVKLEKIQLIYERLRAQFRMLRASRLLEETSEKLRLTRQGRSVFESVLAELI